MQPRICAAASRKLIVNIRIHCVGSRWVPFSGVKSTDSMTADPMHKQCESVVMPTLAPIGLADELTQSFLASRLELQAARLSVQ